MLWARKRIHVPGAARVFMYSLWQVTKHSLLSETGRNRTLYSRFFSCSIYMDTLSNFNNHVSHLLFQLKIYSWGLSWVTPIEPKSVIILFPINPPFTASEYSSDGEFLYIRYKSQEISLIIIFNIEILNYSVMVLAVNVP